MIKENRKKKNILILVFIFIVFSFAISNGNNKNLLWEIKGKSNSIYLIGNINILKEADYPLSDEIEKAFNDSKIIVFEADYDSLELPESQDIQFQNSLIKNGKTLKESIPKKLFAQSSAKALELGYDINDWKVRPMYLANFLYYAKILNLGCGFEYQIDNYFLAKAKKENKIIKTLGSVNYYFGQDINISFNDEIRYLQTFLNELKSINGEVNNITALWKEGNLKDLEKIYFQKETNYPDVFQLNVEMKANTFSKKLEKFLAYSENYLVILPIEYLIGEKGIVKLLKKEGYTIVQK